jgi:hypothetical protein
MKTHSTQCRHHNARFYAVQKLGKTPAIVLYNCPDCKTTLTEQHLFELREAEHVEAKLAVA